jgi:hypothetical protein
MRLRNVIGGPREAHGVDSPDSYARRAKAFLIKHGLSTGLQDRPQTPSAYVSDGRWVVDCDCGNAPSASHEWGLAICFECGSVYRPHFPADRGEIEAELLKRPVANRHFFGDTWVAFRRRRSVDTLDTLRAENVAHGIGG